VEKVESCKFLGVHIYKDVSRSKHTNTVVKRARQCLFPLRRLKRFVMDLQMLKKFKSCTIQSLLTGCITASYGNCLASDCKAKQRVVHTAQYITGAELRSIQDLYTRQCQRKALKMVKDSSHPSHRLSASGIKSGTKRLYPQTIRLLNSYSNQQPGLSAFTSIFYYNLFLFCIRNQGKTQMQTVEVTMFIVATGAGTDRSRQAGKG
jgi:hypothetical protein